MSKVTTPPSLLPAGFGGLALRTALILGGATVAAGDTTQIGLDSVISELATLVAKAVKDSNQNTIRVSGFNNPFDGEQSAGAGIRAKLIERLKKLGVQVQDVAPLALKGEYQVAAADQETDSGKSEKVPAAKITYVLVSKSGKKLLDSEKPVKDEGAGYVTDHADVAKLGSLNVEVKPDKPEETKKKLNDAITSDAKSTSVVIDGTKVRPEQGSKFAVEVLKTKLADPKKAPPQDAYQPAMPVLRKGVPYVDIDLQEVYAVKVYNDNDFEIAAKVTIDGVSVFQFSAERRELQRVLDLRRRTIVRGFRLAQERERVRYVPCLRVLEGPIGQVDC